jgi:glycosyltransferase involved in cell wall biosynthesis
VRRLRVLMVNKFHYLRGGSETYHFAVGKTLEAMGNEVAWFAMEDPKNLPCAQSKYFVPSSDYNGKVSLIKKAREAMTLSYSPVARDNFEALLEDFRPDVIHLNLVHRQITFSILDAPYLREHSVPVVYTSHDYILVCPSCTMLDGEGGVCEDCLSGDFSCCVSKCCVKGSHAKSWLAAREARFLHQKGYYQKVDRIIAPSEFMREKLIQGGFPESQVVHMQNFVKDEVLNHARENCDRTDWTHPYILFFGRLSREKGVDVLVEAFERALPQLPENIRLLVAGNGPERNALEANAKDRVEFVGFKSGEELRSLVAGATLAVCPSVCRENMPYSVAEALAEGTPVIGSYIGGIPEIIIDGETGWLARAGDVESLATSIRKAVKYAQDGAAYHALQQRCRSYVLFNCDQAKYINQLIGLYKLLIAEKSGARG